MAAPIAVSFVCIRFWPAKFELLFVRHISSASIMHSVEGDGLDLEPRGGVTFHSVLVTGWNSLVARYSLWNHSLYDAKFARNFLQSYSLQKIIRYLLQRLLVSKNHSLLVAKFACYSLQKLLVSKKYSSLVMKKARELMFI